MQQLISLSCGTLALLLLELPHVELQLLALQDVPISSATLSRARRNAGQQPSTTELLLNVRVQCTSLLALLKLPLDIVALLCFLCGSSSNLSLLPLSRFLLGSCSSFLLPTDIDSIMSQVPLLEGGSINLHNGILDKGLSPHKLIV